MSILAEIIAHKQTEIAALDARALRRLAESAPAPRDFPAALTKGKRQEGRGGVSLIAELKRASPSKGTEEPFSLDVQAPGTPDSEFGLGSIPLLLVLEGRCS